MKYTNKILDQNMKLLGSMLLLGLIGFTVNAFAESPTVTGSGTVMTAILLTPEFEVDTLEFSETDEIILDVKFHNPSTKFHGLNWVFENAIDGYKPDPTEFYEKYERNRVFYLFINDITEAKQEIDSKQFTITTDNDFIKTTYSDLQESSMIEVLDIDSLVQNFGTGQKIETTLRISSPELLENHDYEIHVWTDTRTTDPVTFTIPTLDPISTPMEMSKDAEEAEKLQEELTVFPAKKGIPIWVKDIFKFYAEDKIGDFELIGALQYLIKEGIIEV